MTRCLAMRLAVLLALAAFSACSTAEGRAKTPAPPSPAPAPPAPSPAGSAATEPSGSTAPATQCGGIAGLPCPAGTVCAYHEVHPDAMGTCRKAGELDTSCGDNQPPCQSGLTCRDVGMGMKQCR